MLIPIATARKRLAIVWFTGAGVTFVAILMLTTFGNSGSGTALWDWFLAAVTPNLSLVVGVLFNDIKRKNALTETTDSFLYRIALWLSAAYLLLLFVSPLLTPFTEVPLETDLQNSRLPLSLVQALATISLGAFYVRREGKS